MEYTIKVTALNNDELVEIISGFNQFSSYWCELLDWDDDFYNEVKDELIASDEYGDIVSFEEILAKMLEKHDDVRSYLKITDEIDSYILRYNDILSGVEKAFNEFGLPLDTDSWDAASSDMIIQLALFGWTVYG
jgi:hypothetical protein